MVKLTLIQGDCLKVLPTIPDNSIDLVLTDPPYGINYVSGYSRNLEYRKNVADTTGWDNFDVLTIPFEHFKRIIRNDCYYYVFSRWDVLWKLPKPNKLLIWNKNDTGMGNLKDWGCGYEVILTFKKGNPFLRGKRESDVLTFWKTANFAVRSNTKNNKMVHPTEKPLALIMKLIEKSTDEGDTIIDPFVGSGTTMEACLKLKRDCIGIEIEPKYIEIAKKRLNWGYSLGDTEFEFRVVE